MKTCYGIFKLQNKESIADYHFIRCANNNLVNNDVEVVVAYSTALETETEAIDKIKELPRPCMYIILPVYFNI